ncbi:retrovirus-related pol polyprotein from transposon TNT 1-94 [Tanacetum coccineum]
MINRVYSVEGLNHNLFSVGQFCDADLEVAFRKSTCFVRDLQGNDLLTDNSVSDLYTNSFQETTSYTWTLFLRSKDETPEVLKDFLKMIQRNLQAQVITIRTNRGIKFLNKTLHANFKEERIEHQISTPLLPEQNDVVERQNRTLVEAARMMLSTSKHPLFFWAEAIATSCYTQNRSIIIPTHEKTAYHIINDWKPSIRHLHIFGCTCYLTKDGENLDKMKEKGDSCIMVGYSTQFKGYSVYNKRTRLIVESIHIKFDEIKEMTETSVDNKTSGLIQQLCTLSVNKLSYPSNNSKQQDTPPIVNVQSTTESITPTTTVTIEENNTDKQAQIQVDNAHVDDNKFYNVFSTPVREAAESSSHYVDLSNMHIFYQPHQSEHRWTKDHPLSQVRGNPSKPVQTR